jgi:hypothetical protein
LVGLGWLNKTGKGGNRRSTRYTICPPPALGEVVETATLPVVETASPPVAETANPPVAKTTNPNRRGKRKRKEEENKPPNPLENVLELEFEGWWKNWLVGIRITSPERTNSGNKAAAEEYFSKWRTAGWSVETITVVTGKYLRATKKQRKNAEGFLKPENKLVSQYFTQEVSATATPTATAKKATWDEVVPTAALEVVPETIEVVPETLIEAEYDAHDIERFARSLG